MTPTVPMVEEDSLRFLDSRRVLYLTLAVLLLLAQALPLIYTRWVEDENWYSASAGSLASHGELRMRIFAPPGQEALFDARPPLPMLAMAGAFKLVGTNLYSAKLPFLLCAIAGIIATYLLGCELESPRLGLLAALFLAADNLYFMAARTVRPESMVAAFSVAGVLLYLMALRRGSALLALAAGMTVGVAALAHPNGLAAAIVAGVLTYMEFGVGMVRRLRPWAFVAGLLLALTPYVWTDLSNPVRRQEFLRVYEGGQGQPLSNIPQLEFSRYWDFLGMDSTRFHMPVPLPYRLHVVLALLAAAFILYRWNRPLFKKLAVMILCCMVWWAYLRFQTSRYIATGSPYLALLLAGGVLTIWNRKPAWRKAIAVTAAMLLAAQVGSNYFLLYMYRKSDYADVTRKLRALIPQDAGVYGAITFWMALNDHTYYSWNRAPLQYALDHGVTYLVLNDRVLLHGSGFGKDDWIETRNIADAYVRDNAALVGRVPNSFYGDLEVYRVNHPSPPVGR